ncbi:hypothetical protein A9R05_00825 [Burkholderia sp. KK1]|nr:hypothetical protein A9R05_00825 [Burkholderia sp. KK1]
MLLSDERSWTIAYYDEQLQREIRDLPIGIRSDYWRLVDLMKLHGANLRMPHSRAMGGGLFELRPRGRDGIGRVFYCMVTGRRIVMLHSFIKKTRQTPEDELRIAHARMKEVKGNV